MATLTQSPENMTLNLHVLQTQISKTLVRQTITPLHFQIHHTKAKGKLRIIWAQITTSEYESVTK